jgi:F0F1-type ATP synthase assembly protein I
MDENHDSAMTLLDAAVRGILLGGGMGAIASWFFMDLGRGLFLGMLVGCLAGVTIKAAKDRRGN